MADNRNRDKAREIFDRLDEVYDRGHIRWMQRAVRNERFYNGGGEQWDDDVRAYLESEQGGMRPCFEANLVKPTINAIVGYQIANRVDLSFVPRGGESDEHTAKLLSKVVRQMLDNARWRHKETHCFLDGLILQRGFLDLRMSYENNDLGELEIRVIDPLDAIPDPDASEYDPDTWADFIETRWLTAAQIEGAYGADVAEQIGAYSDELTDEDNFGVDEGVDRRTFGDDGGIVYGRMYYGREGPNRRYRIVNRQSNEYQTTLVARWPTGDIRIIEGQPPEYIAGLLERGVHVFKRRMRRVRMQIAGPSTLIHDDISPYSHITAIPFFPYFRRGRTTGDVDDLISIQEMLNKFLSQYAHVVNSSANGGWQSEQGQLVSPHEDELAQVGAKTGLHIIRKPGTQPLQKITPNQVPQGLTQMIEFAYRNFQLVSGVDEAMLGMPGKDLSGVAVQSLQYAAQMKKAIVHDNMSLTRRLVADRTLDIVQRYMGSERVFRITEEDAYGVERRVPFELNKRMDDGTIYNDLTIGTYDLVMSEQPAVVTFDNSQFEQMMTMREKGIPIKDSRIVRASNLENRSEIAEELDQMQGGGDQPDPAAEAAAALDQARAAKLQADAEKVRAETFTKNVEGLFSAVKTGREIVFTPQIAALADQLARSAGFVDHDAPPIIPEAEGLEVPPEAIGAENTNPLTPPNPQRGLDTGLTSTTETGENHGEDEADF